MKETVGIDILATSRNVGRKIMQSIKITSHENKEVELVEPVSCTSTEVLHIEKT